MLLDRYTMQVKNILEYSKHHKTFISSHQYYIWELTPTHPFLYMK